jgi:hypothetical protein
VSLFRRATTFGAHVEGFIDKPLDLDALDVLIDSIIARAPIAEEKPRYANEYCS